MKILIDSQKKQIIIIKIVIIALAVLIFIPFSPNWNFLTVTTHYNYGTKFLIFQPVLIFLIIGIILNLFSIKDTDNFRFISFIGLAIIITGFIVNLVLHLILGYSDDYFLIEIHFEPSFYLVLIVIGIMIFEKVQYFYIKNKELIKLDEKKEIAGEIAQKSKGFLRKGLKTVTKKVGKMTGDMVGDMVEDKLIEITGDDDLADMVGDLTDVGVSKLTQAGLSKLTEQALKPPKSKGFLKKGLKGVTKKVGKIAGDMVGDAISDMTDNAELGEMVGKFTKKGVSKLSDTALVDKHKSPHLPIGTYPVSEPIKIDYKKSILGIIKTKKQVKIDYIETILKLKHNDVVGMIYELIGKGKIEGEFNSNDSEFILKD